MDTGVDRPRDVPIKEFGRSSDTRDMLARDPALRERFERRLKEAPAFAANPQARLDFFYRRHPAWDTRYNLYPVLRVEASW